jgi:hypothetical protein
VDVSELEFTGSSSNQCVSSLDVCSLQRLCPRSIHDLRQCVVDDACSSPISHTQSPLQSQRCACLPHPTAMATSPGPSAPAPPLINSSPHLYNSFICLVGCIVYGYFMCGVLNFLCNNLISNGFHVRVDLTATCHSPRSLTFPSCDPNTQMLHTTRLPGELPEHHRPYNTCKCQ